MCSFICPKFILIEILWAEHLFKRKSRLLFIYDDTPEGGGRGARGKFCRNEKDGRYTILNYKVDEPGKGGKIHFFKTASRSDDGGEGGGQRSNIILCNVDDQRWGEGGPIIENKFISHKTSTKGKRERSKLQTGISVPPPPPPPAWRFCEKSEKPSRVWGNQNSHFLWLKCQKMMILL